jgi:enamine deaminase RidA (YjgF/YER057c/UK114 family)
MTDVLIRHQPARSIDLDRLSDGEREELQQLGMLPDKTGRIPAASTRDGDAAVWPRAATSVPQVLNEAYDYTKPSSFSRALAFPLGDATLLLISGTASVDEQGASVHLGDFRAQLWRTFRNITAILDANGMAWPDIIRTTCYLRDIERDYADFNAVRTAFFSWNGLTPLPASTGIQARLCREDLLVEIEAIAIKRTPSP